MPDRMSEDMPEDMPDRVSEDVPQTKFPLKEVLGVKGVLGAPRAPKQLQFEDLFGARARAARPGPLSL